MSALSRCPPLAKQMSESDMDNIMLGMRMRVEVKRARWCTDECGRRNRVVRAKQALIHYCS
jgi:hypothetical protein